MGFSPVLYGPIHIMLIICVVLARVSRFSHVVFRSEAGRVVRSGVRTSMIGEEGSSMSIRVFNRC